MTTIHPEYFPFKNGDGGLWHIAEPSLAAPSLRELRKLLGPGRWRIVGYFPNGFKVPAWPADVKQQRKALPLILHSPQTFNPTGPRAATTKYHEQMLDLWRDGMSSPMIGIKCGGVSRGTVMGVVDRARKRGDPRAVVRKARGQI